MIKILHVINSTNFGGIPSMILNYYSNMDRNEIHFDFVCHQKEDGESAKIFKSMGSKVFYIPRKRDSVFKYISELNKIIKNEKYEVIHVHQNLSSYLALIVAYKNKIPVRIAHAHGADLSKKNILIRISMYISHFLIKFFSTKCLACSNDSLKYVFGRKNEKTIILPNAIYINKYKYNKDNRNRIRKELNILDNVTLLGTVGRMSKEKNHIFLIQLLPKLLEKNKNYKLVIVGDGEEYERCLSLAKELKVDNNIIFTGAREDIPALMSAFDIFLFPSLNEGLGIVAVEAAASGLHIIMSNNIPKDLDFIPESKYVVLNVNNWIEEINKTSIKRINCENELNENGYNIFEATKKLEYIYKGMK